jgi:hypothetical protein
MKNIQFQDENLSPVILLVGKRGSGKSIVIREILENLKDIPVKAVVSCEGNSFYKKFLPSTLIYEKYEQNIVENILQHQENDNTLLDSRKIVVFDDCLFGSTTLENNNILGQLIMNCRHYNIIPIIAIQFPLYIDPIVKRNIDYVFIFREDYNGNKKRIYENYAGIFPSFNSFCKVMNQCTYI